MSLQVTLCRTHQGLLGGREDTGYLPYPVDPMTGFPIFQVGCSMCEVNKNWVKEASCTTKSWSPMPRKLDYQESLPTLVPAMPNSPSLMLAEPMFGKKTPELPERSSSLVLTAQDAIVKLTGMPSEFLLSRAISKTFRPTYIFDITGISKELAVTIFRQLQLSEPVTFFGAELVLANHVEHGKKPALKLFLKVSAGFLTYRPEQQILGRLSRPCVSCH